MREKNPDKAVEGNVGAVSAANDSIWQPWLELFRARSRRPLPETEPDFDYCRVPASVARSLAVFQLGESGGGSVIDQARTSRLDGIDATYADCMELFVAEEHRHAHVLAICVSLLGGELLRKNWTARLFVSGRRLMGLRLKVLVLLAAEVVGLCYYELVASRLPPCRVREWLREMQHDEQDHLGYHCHFFRMQASSKWRRAVFKLGWRTLMRMCEVVVLIDHRHALRDLGISRHEVRRSWRKFSRQAEAVVVDGQKLLSTLARA
jgi:uncharacterized protein YjiS (DUF1127 family)